MSLETFINQYRPTLNGNIEGSATTLVLSSVSSLPLEGNCRILIEQEIIIITLNGTTTVVAARGQEGTTAVGHRDGLIIYFVLTAGALNQSRLEFYNYDIYANRDVNGNIGRRYRDSDGNTEGFDNGSSWNDFGWSPPHIVPPKMTDYLRFGFAATTATNANIFVKTSGSVPFIYTTYENFESKQFGAFVQPVNSDGSVAWTAIVGFETNFSSSSIMSAGICLTDITGKISLFGVQCSNSTTSFLNLNGTITDDTATTADSNVISLISNVTSPSELDFKFYMIKYFPSFSTTSIFLFQSVNGINFAYMGTFTFDSMGMVRPSHVGFYLYSFVTYTYNSQYPGCTLFQNTYKEP